MKIISPRVILYTIICKMSKSVDSPCMIISKYLSNEQISVTNFSILTDHHQVSVISPPQILFCNSNPAVWRRILMGNYDNLGER